MPAEMAERVDRSKRAEYIKHRHNLEAAWADEAVADPEAVWLDPDPASVSGLSARVIGYSLSARAVLSVVLIAAGTDPDDRPQGQWWGANAWRSNARDRRIYEQAQQGGTQ